MENSSLDLDRALKLLESDEEFSKELTSSIGETVERVTGSHVRIESSTALSQDEKKQMETQLERIFDRKLSAFYAIKPQLLGGFRVVVGDWKLDASLVTQLEVMKRIVEGIAA